MNGEFCVVNRGLIRAVVRISEFICHNIVRTVITYIFRVKKVVHVTRCVMVLYFPPVGKIQLYETSELGRLGSCIRFKCRNLLYVFMAEVELHEL